MNRCSHSVEHKGFTFHCERDDGHPNPHQYVVPEGCPFFVTNGVWCCDHWGPNAAINQKACLTCSGTAEWQAAHPDVDERGYELRPA